MQQSLARSKFQTLAGYPVGFVQDPLSHLRPVCTAM
jgi:hypothetical protein